jgi:hypothetical protein
MIEMYKTTGDVAWLDQAQSALDSLHDSLGQWLGTSQRVVSPVVWKNEMAHSSG